MKRLFLIFSLLLSAMWVNAEDVIVPDSFVSPFKNYQSWQEPTVQDWQETQRQLVNKPSEHADHEDMNMKNMPAMNQDDMTQEDMMKPNDSKKTGVDK